MRASVPQHLAEHRRLVLRTASAALHGRPVMLLRVASGGRLVTETATGPTAAPDPVEHDVVQTLRAWDLPLSEGDLWIACRRDGPGWQLARVRGDMPQPSPSGVENRSANRLTLELAGLVLGAFERSVAAADQVTVYLCAAASVLETCLDRVRDAAGLTTAARARLLADLAGVATAIEGALQAA
jgi:hypothetical protein